MRDLRILGTQARYAILTALRSPRVMIFGVAFPIVLLVLFCSIFAQNGSATTHVAGHAIATKAYYTAGVAAYAIMVQTFTSLSISVTTQRETGQLKRLRGTPVPAWTFIAAYVLRCLFYVALVVVALFAIGVLAFDVHLHGPGVLGMVVYVLLGTASLAALGLAVTIICPTAEVASAVGPFAAVLLGFVSGAFIPVSVLPDWLATIGKVFPLAHLATGLQRGLTVGLHHTGLNAENVGVLAAWALGALVFAAWQFRWEPQGATG